MALTTLDPKTALVVIDLQKGIVSLPTVHPIGEVIERTASLANAFRRHELPVVLVNVSGGAPGRVEFKRPGSKAARPADWAEIVDELRPQPQDLQVTKQRWGAFYGTMLDAYLKEVGVTQIVLTGVATSAGVESTARAAHENGYHVTLATDAVTDTIAAAHENSLQWIFPRLGETGTTAEILELLEKTR